MKTTTFLTVICALIFGVAGTAAAQSSDAKLRTGDSFDLRIGGVPGDDMTQISSNYTVDGEGCLNLAYLNKVRVAGMTASQIQATIEKAYVERGIFTHPTITLSIAPSARFVNVSGSVKSPGRIPYTPDMTVITAINAAGDFNDFAKESGVKLVRGEVIKVINCSRARKDPSLDEKVLPGDNIYVPQSMF